MNPTLKIGAAVAAVLVLAIVGWNMLPGRSTGVGGPVATATPTSSPSATSNPTPVPTTPWWLGSDQQCGQAPGAAYGCAGELAAGTITSGGLDPALTYSVPIGWVNVRDWAKYYALFPDTPANRTAVATGDPAQGIVIVIGEPAVPVANADCSGTPQPGIGTSAAEVAAALVARDGLVIATSQPITVSGLTGQQFDISMEPAWTGTCADNETNPPVDPETPAVPLIGEISPDVVSGDDRYRLIILDTPDGGNIAIELFVNRATEFEPFLAAAMPVVETFEFDLTP